MSWPPCLCCSKGHKHGVSIQSSVNLGDTLLRIARERKTAETRFLVRLFILQSSIISQILEFIYWMVGCFSFDHMTGENREYKKTMMNFQKNITRLRIPTGRRQTSWLFTSAAEKLNSGLPRTRSASGQNGISTRPTDFKSDALTTRHAASINTHTYLHTYILHLRYHKQINTSNTLKRKFKRLTLCE